LRDKHAVFSADAYLPRDAAEEGTSIKPWMRWAGEGALLCLLLLVLALLLTRNAKPATAVAGRGPAQQPSSGPARQAPTRDWLAVTAVGRGGEEGKGWVCTCPGVRPVACR